MVAPENLDLVVKVRILAGQPRYADLFDKIGRNFGSP